MSAKRQGLTGVSVNKILVIFGIVATAVTVPLIVLYFCLPSILGRFTGLVENSIVGILGGVLITVVLTLILNLSHQKETEKVARVVLSEVSVVVNRLMDLFGQMVKAASDGFMPSTVDDLFGDKAAELISLHLHLDGHAPDTSETVWIDYIALESEQFITALSLLRSRYIAFLSEDMFEALTALKNNDLMNMLAHCRNLHKWDVKSHIRRPVLKIPLDQLRPLMAEILVSVKTMEKEAVKLNARIVPKFPQFALSADVEPKIGSARYDGEPGPGMSSRTPEA